MPIIKRPQLEIVLASLGPCLCNYSGLSLVFMNKRDGLDLARRREIPLFGAHGVRLVSFESESEKRAGPINAVHELAVWQGDEQGDDQAEVKGQKGSHGGALPQREQQQAADRDKKEQGQKSIFCAEQTSCGGGRITDDLHPNKSSSPDREEHTTDRSEKHRNAEERIGRDLMQKMIVDRRHAGRCEAEQETIEHGVMKPAPPHREAVAHVIASVPATTEIFQRENVVERLGKRAGTDEIGRRALRAAPEIAESHRECDQGVDECCARNAHHEAPRQDAVECARAGMRRRQLGWVPEQHGAEDDDSDTEGREQAKECAISLKHARR